MVVQHNISAMTANRYYGINNKSLAGSLEKLASGYAINKAGDNAAGLAVSEKMRAQIGGLTQASKNAEDGISMVQTFEGALQETDSILQRMRTLAVQSANGSYQNEVDRDAIQLEFDQLNDELNQIADTDFNGVVMLNGGVMADGTVANDPSKISKRPNIDDINASPDAAFTYKGIVNGTVDASANGSISVNGVSMQITSGHGQVELGNTASGRTTYSTSDITVDHGNVNGTINASETYKIDSESKNITIHGETYTIGANSLQDANGDDVNFIDGMQVTLTPGSDVKLEGSYFIKDNVVTEGLSFKQGKVSGTLDTDLNGTIAVNDAKIGVDAGALDTNVTTNKSADGKLTYTLKTDFTEDTPVTNPDGSVTRAVSGAVEANGTYTAATVTTQESTAITFTSNGTVGNAAGTGTVNVYKTNINGVDYTVTEDGSKWFKGATGAPGLDDTTAWKSQSDMFAASASSADIVNITAPTGTVNLGSDATGWTYTVTQNQVTTNDGTKIVLSGDKSKILSGGTLATGADAGLKTTTSDGITYTNANGTLTGKGEWTVTAASVKGGDEVGSFKISKGVSTSDAYNHGTRNLTFADSMTLQVGARGKDAVKFNFDYTTNGIGTLKADMNASARGLGTDQLSLRSSEEANYAIDQIDNAINKTNMIRATFGSVQNRLEHKISNLDTNNENLTAAESRIRDTQMDKEMMKFTSAQILSQASQSMLAQANSLPQGVLQLLG